MESSFRTDATHGESDLMYNKRTADYIEIYDDIIRMTNDIQALKNDISVRLGGTRGMFDKIDRDLKELKDKMSK